MLSKFAFPSRYSRLVVIALCLVSACFQQVMSLEHGDSSRVSTAKSRINSHGDVQKQSGSSSTCWITMETKNALFPEIFAQLFFPDWFCVIVLLLFVILQAGTRDVIQEFEEHKTASEAKLQAAENESSIYKLRIDQQNSSLQNHVRSLIQEVSNLKAELDSFRSHSISLDSHPSRDAAKVSNHVRQVPAGVHPPSQKCAAKASGPVSKVPSDILSKQKLASMASVPVHRVPAAQKGARAPEQNHAVAFLSAVVASTSKIDPEKVVRNGSGFQVEHNHGRVSEKVKHHGGISSKEENRGGRPVPGSSSFVCANQMDTSTAQVKKLLSGDSVI